jgi:hypothetical protein
MQPLSRAATGPVDPGARQRIKRAVGRGARAVLSLADRDGLHRVPLGPAAGLRLDLSLRDVPVDMYLGVFEWEVWRHLREMVEPGMRAVDVGGHLGWYALIIARRTQAPVWSFEPDPANAEVLRRNLRENPDCGRHVIAHAGRCAASGTDPEEEIAIDELFSGRRPPGLIKVDVDGPEVEVLEGAARTLTDSRPHVVVETHSAELERRCADLLTRAGYRPLIVTSRDLWHLGQNRPGEHNRWLVAYGASRSPRSSGSGASPPSSRTTSAVHGLVRSDGA